MLPTAGALASARWLEQRGFDAAGIPHWYAEMTMFTARPTESAVRFDLNIFPEEWGYVVRDGTRMSSIRITDVAFAHGRDDLALLPHTPADLDGLGALFQRVEAQLGTRFVRAGATVRSNLVRATAVIRVWLATV